MMDETLDTVTGIDTEEMEEEIQKEVDKVRKISLKLIKIVRINFF